MENFSDSSGREEVSMKPAAEIVETVKRFGQEDDITVVTVTRTAAVATAA